MTRKARPRADRSEAPQLAGKAVRSPGRIFLGTSGWAYSSWKPDFYPQSVPQKKFLEYYASKLNSVEVNYTFRQLPTERMLSGWLGLTDTDFRFSFKAPQRITHMLRLKNCSDAVAEFSSALTPVVAARRMGLVLFQFPPDFKADAIRLDSFLTDAKSGGLRMAFEFRHDSWFCDEVYAVLRSHSVALCVAESDDLETPEIVTAPFTCYRFRKSKYDAAKLVAIEKQLRTRSAEGDVFAYFKHEERPDGALSARKIFRKLH